MADTSGNEPENEPTNAPNLKDIIKFGRGELHKRIGQFLTPGAGFRLGQAMGDMGMVREYKRIGEQKFTSHLPILTEDFIARHRAALQKERRSGGGLQGRAFGPRPQVKRISYQKKETYRGPVSKSEYTIAMRKGMRKGN